MNLNNNLHDRSSRDDVYKRHNLPEATHDKISNMTLLNVMKTVSVIEKSNKVNGYDAYDTCDAF